MSIIRSNDLTGFLVVSPSGHLVTAPSRLTDAEVTAGAKPDIKPGFRFATAEDVAAVEKIEADRAAKEGKLAPKTGPLKGA